MELGFAKFLDLPDAKLTWYDRISLLNRIDELGYDERWYKLVLFEAMIFEAYYPINTEKNEKGEEIPCRKYDTLRKDFEKFNQGFGDMFLELVFNLGESPGHIYRLRESYKKAMKDLNKNWRITPINMIIVAGSIIVLALTAGIFAGPIAIALVGSEFAGLSGAALTSACLAYIGGGAIAVGGAGMSGGVVAIVGGGVILGASAGTVINTVGGMGKEITATQSAKLLVAMKEIFLNEEQDIEFSNVVCEEYVNNLTELEKKITELKAREQSLSNEEKNEIKKEIANLEEIADTMGLTIKSMTRFKNAFEVGMKEEIDC